MNNIKIDCVLDAKANLGEGAIWSVKDQMLYWVDINKGLLCKFNPENGKNISFDFEKPIGCFALKSNLNVILALTDGFFEFDQIKKTKILIDNTESNILELSLIHI